MMGAVVTPVVLTGQIETDVVSQITRFLGAHVRLGCVRVMLAQRVSEDVHHTLSEWSMTEDPGELMGLAHELYAMAAQEARTLREGSAYGVFAFRPSDAGPVGHIYFRVEGGAGWAGSRPTTTPNERGMVAMLMEHTQLAARLSLGHSREIVDQYQTLLGVGTDHLRALLEQAYGRIKVLEAREREAFELRDKLQSMSLERQFDHELRLKAQDIDAAAAARKDQMRAVGIQSLAKFIPLLFLKVGIRDANLAEVAAQAAAAAAASGAATAPSAEASSSAGDRAAAPNPSPGRTPNGPVAAAAAAAAPTAGAAPSAEARAAAPSPSPARTPEGSLVAAPPPAGGGGPPGPQGTPSLEILLDMFMNSFTHEQTAALMSLLRPEQLVLFAQIHQSITARTAATRTPDVPAASPSNDTDQGSRHPA